MFIAEVINRKSQIVAVNLNTKINFFSRLCHFGRPYNTVHTRIGQYMCRADSICAAQTLSVPVSDSICENHIDMSSYKAKNGGKSLKVKCSIATTGQLHNKA